MAVSLITGHLGRWSRRSNPVPSKCANGSEWQFYSFSSCWQMKCRSAARSADPPVDLPMDLNGNSTLLSSYWQMKWQISWQIYPTHSRSANGSEWQFYSLRWCGISMAIVLIVSSEAHIGRWSGKSTGRSTPPPYRSANGLWMAIVLLQFIFADDVTNLLADLPQPPVDLPIYLNGNSTLWGHIGRWSGRSNPPLSRSANGSEWQFCSLSSHG